MAVCVRKINRKKFTFKQRNNALTETRAGHFGELQANTLSVSSTTRFIAEGLNFSGSGEVENHLKLESDCDVGTKAVFDPRKTARVSFDYC